MEVSKGSRRSTISAHKSRCANRTLQLDKDVVVLNQLTEKISYQLTRLRISFRLTEARSRAILDRHSVPKTPEKYWRRFQMLT
jgi:adenylate kinase